jgi:Tol biopolymer transport system component
VSSSFRRRSEATRRQVVLAATVLFASLLALAAPARAAFPGANGKIAFTSDPTGSDLEDCSMNADGSALTDLSNNPASDLTPAWSPDGQRIAFATDRDLNDEIYVMAADGTGRANVRLNSASDTAPA